MFLLFKAQTVVRGRRQSAAGFVVGLICLECRLEVKITVWRQFYGNTRGSEKKGSRRVWISEGASLETSTTFSDLPIDVNRSHRPSILSLHRQPSVMPSGHLACEAPLQHRGIRSACCYTSLRWNQSNGTRPWWTLSLASRLHCPFAAESVTRRHPIGQAKTVQNGDQRGLRRRSDPYTQRSTVQQKRRRQDSRHQTANSRRRACCYGK